MLREPKPIVPVKPGSVNIARALLLPDPKSYVTLPGRSYGNYSYPDLLVSMEKSHHDKSWDEASKALHEKGEFMLTLRQLVDFLNLLKSEKIYNGLGNEIDSSITDNIRNEILETREPLRGEWLDLKSTKREEDYYITYHSINLIIN